MDIESYSSKKFRQLMCELLLCLTNELERFHTMEHTEQTASHAAP